MISIKYSVNYTILVPVHRSGPFTAACTVSILIMGCVVGMVTHTHLTLCLAAASLGTLYIDGAKMNQIFGHIVSEMSDILFLKAGMRRLTARRSWVRPAERPRSLHVTHVRVLSGSKDIRTKSTDYSGSTDWEQGEPLSRVNPGSAPASRRHPQRINNKQNDWLTVFKSDIALAILLLRRVLRQMCNSVI